MNTIIRSPLIVTLLCVIFASNAIDGYRVECVFEHRTELGGYSCSVFNVNLTLPRLSISFSGVHEERFTNADVIGIRFVNVHLEYLPNEIFTTFKNLQKLFIENVDLENIAGDDLKGATQLDEIRATGNRLWNIDATTFANTSNLWILNLNQNKIRTIHPEAFRGLRSLSTLQLNDNKLAELNEGLFAKQENLITLSINDNYISKLSGSIFNGLSKLRTLYLGRNRLTELPSDIFLNLLELRTLWLLDNKLSAIDNLLFSQSYNLRDLRLSGNQITAIHPNAFINLQNINTLRLGQNVCVDKNFNNLNGNLELVDPYLSTCFEGFPGRTVNCVFRNFYRYTCMISNLELNPGETITITGNHVHNLTNDDVFSVVISSSNIPTIPHDFFKVFPNLNFFKAEANRISILRPLRNCQALTHFIVPRNRITTVDSAIFSACPNLSVIDLSNNSINKIHPTFIDGLSNLTHVLLMGNVCVNEDFSMQNPGNIQNILKSLENCFN